MRVFAMADLIRIPLPSQTVRAIFWSQWGYWVTTLSAIWAHFYVPPGTAQTIVILTPILPGIMMFYVAYDLYRDRDEYLRLQIMKATALTAIVVAACVLVYSLLELLGFPRLSMMWVHIGIWGLFGVLLFKLALAQR